MRPSRLGLPARYTSWRKGQWSVIWESARSRKRFLGYVLPTGFGKTLTYVGASRLQGHRFAVLCATRPHQDQLISQLEGMGHLTDIRGAGNYECLLKTKDDIDLPKPRTCDSGHCKAGVSCDLRQAGCLYFDTVRSALAAEIVVTNYAYWMHSYEYGEGLGHFDALVLDEAHEAPGQLSNFLGCTISESDILIFGLGYPSIRDWRTWVRDSALKMEIAASHETAVDQLLQIKRLQQSLAKLMIGDPVDWNIEHVGRSLRFDVIWPDAYAEHVLFRGIDRITLVSATLRRKTLALLGIKKGDYRWIERKSDFPLDRRPVYFIPTAKIDRKTTPEQLGKWRARIEEITSSRFDRKGIIQTVSYERRDTIASTVSNNGFVTHRRRQLTDGIERFKGAAEGAVLVSPSAVQGFDFAGRACEYQIIAKLPFPDQSSRLLRIRSQGDPDYAMYLTAQSIEQMTGRHMRDRRDRGETFIIDDNWRWFFGRYYRYFTLSFRLAAQTRATVPPPPPRAPLTVGAIRASINHQ